MESKEQQGTTTLDPTVGADPYLDPIGYLAGLGIEAELVGIERTQLPAAA